MNEALRKKFQRVVALFNQPSTWRGFVVTLTGVGAALEPAQSEAIVAGGLVIAGLIAIFLEP